MKTEEEINEILRILADEYPAPQTELNYKTPFQLLIATILSAQTTDRQVNKITTELFSKYNNPEDFLDLTPEELAEEIHGVGLYRNKSKYILKTCQKLVDEYDSQIPKTREELMELSGVGRKTANVVLSCAFEFDTIAVDTHVFRVTNRLGIANSDNVRRTEEELMKNLPQDKWSSAHHWFIFHGREICKARNPRCGECPVNHLCDYYKELD
ncbi:endonuclease III [Acetohalobium arabaticum]|uniref:Endonuclease III n=1 Tax=Acetohalobium arabaticum (strain ATCC 49924 / DSM 5501 / Z-7288) TaxID=574087 RepID=D9QQQ9_ACEAZ|nr:endonuclease III [Acetohalobium arabaticum]ADL12850.1 endonuclease III; DNA-(apurinic or apyrimidinic site) lyase [Acetohalobium arabaticum DSM 5501]